MEEKNLLGETYGNSKKELESLMFQLEERAKEKQTSEDTLQCEIENLKAEILEKSALQTRLKELEEVIAKKSITEEVRKSEYCLFVLIHVRSQGAASNTSSLRIGVFCHTSKHIF